MNHVGFSPAFLYFLSVLAARTLVIFVFVVAGFRLLGKRQLGNLNVYDLALVMALANAVQNAMTSGKGDLAVGIVCGGMLLVIGRLSSHLFLRLPRFEQALVGMPTVIIQDGELIRDHIRREGLTRDQVLQAIRQHGFASPRDVRMAVLETDGSISIVPAKKPEDDPGGDPVGVS